MGSLTDVAASLYGTGGAREREAEQMKIRANAMRPEYAKITQAADDQAKIAAQRPTLPVLGEPPSRGLRDFLATSENESPLTSVSKLVQALSLFAGATVGTTRHNAMGAMAAFAGALKGWQAGDAERADRSFKDWEAQTGKALKQYDLERTAYNDALTAGGLTLDARMKQAQIKALEYGDTQAILAFESGSIDKALGFLTSQDAAASKLTIEMQKLLEQRAQAEARMDESRARREDLNQWRDDTAQYRRDVLEDRAAARAEKRDAKGDDKATPPAELKTSQATAMSLGYVKEMKRLVPGVRMEKIVGGVAPWLNQIDQTGKIGPIPLPKELLGSLTENERRLLALTEDYADKILRDRSGAAVTDSEFVRMLRFLVSSAATPEAFTSRLQLQEDILKATQTTQRGVVSSGGYRAPEAPEVTIGSGGDLKGARDATVAQMFPNKAWSALTPTEKDAVAKRMDGK